MTAAILEKSDMVKRLFDIVCSILALVVLSPALITIAVMVNREDRGPVFYRGTRTGRFGKPFRIVKFRTMVVDAEKLGGSSTADDDPRISRVGRTLRKYKLDELPQLFNVLKGEMSIVGPRPQVPWAVELYSEAERALLSVRPGITDYASIKFRDEGAILRASGDPDRDYLEKIAPEKIRLGLEYVRTQSLATDMKLILLTLTSMLKGSDL